MRSVIFADCRGWSRPPPTETVHPPEVAGGDDGVPVSPSRSQGSTRETAVASGTEGVGGGGMSHDTAGSTSTTQPRDTTSEEPGFAQRAPTEAALPPLEEVHKLNFVGKMTQLTGEPSPPRNSWNGVHLSIL